MKKIRLGVIGTGMAWERLHYPALQELGDKYEIVALCNRTKKDAEDFAKKIHLDPANIYDDYHALLKRDDIDVVDIIVPIEMNYIISEETARAGKHFICEKPLAPDREQAQKFLQIAGRYNVKMMIAENFRYSEEYNKIKGMVREGRIGEAVYFIWNNASCFPCSMTQNTFAATEWRQHPKYVGGAFLDGGVHDIAGMRYVFGNVKCAQAFGKPQQEEYNPYMSVNANILFDSGVIGQYTYFPAGLENQKPLIGLRIFGTKGQIYLEEKDCGVINVAYNDGTSEQVKYTPGRGFYNELLNFYNALQGTENIHVTPEIEFGDAKMVFDILESIEKRKIIYVDGPQPEEFSKYVEGKEQIRPYIQ